jgi:hypothetical protein
MSRLHVWRNGRFAVVALAVTTPLEASQASRAVRSCFVEWQGTDGRRFYFNGRRIAV